MNTEGKKESIMPRKRYETISIPSDLLTRVQEILDKDNWGYTSKTEFIKVAVREKLLKIEERKRLNKQLADKE